MGHVEQSRLPKTKPYEDVLRTVRHGAHAPQVAAMVVRAVLAALQHAKDDPGVLATVRLLVDLPRLARAEDAVARLRERLPGLPAEFGLAQFLAAALDALDAAAPPTDLGEMARTAAVETLAQAVGPALHALFDPGPDGLVEGLARLKTVARFGELMSRFYGRLVAKALHYVASRALAEEVGPGTRFRTLADERAFNSAMGDYCDASAAAVAAYAGEWLSKHDYESGGVISDREVEGFAAFALDKLTRRLLRAEGASRAA